MRTPPLFFRLLLALTPVLALSCCVPFAAPEGDGSLVVMSWNVLSLFDAVEDGNEYADFSISRGTWGETRYRNRLELLGKAILASREKGPGSPPGPDIVCLIEIEKESILADLAAGVLAEGGYRYRGFAKAPGSPIGVGVLSRLPISEARAWGLVLGERSERPILEARIAAGEASLVIFVCHWKSKIEGAAVTEPARRASAGLLSRLMTERQAALPGAAILACGDFNENPDEYARTGRRYPTAFMPAPEAGASGEGAIRLGDRKTVGSGEARDLFFSPWSESEAYSYVHQGIRERIDGFVVASGLLDGRDLELRDFQVFDGAGLVDDAGRPLPWSNATARGWSDHLPLLLGISRMPKPGTP